MINSNKEKFHLSENFLNNFKGKQPDWGPVGYATYKRSYARQIDNEGNTEEFWQTVKRVVEGCYTAQLNHCRSNGLPWNAYKSQKSAQRMFELIWYFRFSPPGRGMQHMGADVVWIKGSSVLQNCAYIDTENINIDFINPFRFLMDQSFLGVGVGFGCEGANKIEIREPKLDDTTYVVEDSREGWTDICMRVLSAYVDKNTTLPTNIDFSKIRKKGSPIKTLGGIAPGPEPLKVCINELKELLSGERERNKKRFLMSQLFRELYMGLIFYPKLFSVTDKIFDEELFMTLVGNPYFIKRNTGVQEDEIFKGLKRRCLYTGDDYIQHMLINNKKFTNKYLPYSLVCLRGAYEFLTEEEFKHVMTYMNDLFNSTTITDVNISTFNDLYNQVQEDADEYFVKITSRAGTLINSVDIVDIMNILGKCVVSGGQRRTAEIAISSPNDYKFIECKNPELHSYELFKWRWASNNSISITDDNYKDVNWEYIGKHIEENGEPGVVWIDNSRKYGRFKDEINWKDYRASGVNPCGEMTLEGKSGELCNLCELFPSNHNSLEEYLETIKYAYLYAKSITLIPTHDQRTNSVMLRNRRIGLSNSGIVQAFEKFGRNDFFEWCDNGYKYLEELDRKYSEWLCIPRSIKMSTIKPSGSISLLPGVTPGIHYPHSEYYYRLIRFQNTSNLLQPLKDAGYRVEPSVYNDNTEVVYFPIHEKNFDRSKSEVSIWEQVENAAKMNYYWSDNSVSVTVTFNPETEGKDIPKILELYSDRLKTVSFLPVTSHSYPQAPYQEITKEEYESYASQLKPYSFDKIKDSHEIDEKFCDGDSCTL